MKGPLFGWVISLLFLAAGFLNSSQAGVRTIYTTDKQMRPVYLRMDRSTILRFLDAPEKVILGNQNYFNVEFTGNDVTIQPQGEVDSNIFIYSSFDRVFGLVLNVTASFRLKTFKFQKIPH